MIVLHPHTIGLDTSTKITIDATVIRHFVISVNVAVYFTQLVHSQVTIIFVVSVGLSVCLCRVFLSRL